MSPESTKKAVKNQFVSLLSNAGTTVNEPELFRTWKAFGSFACTTVEQTHGVLMFECGPLGLGTEQSHFYVHFLRILYLEMEEGWDDLMVDCNFEFAPVPELSGFKVDIVVDAGATPEPTAFLAEIEAQQELWQALQNYIARQGTIYIGSQ